MNYQQWHTIDSAPKDGTRIIATWNPEIYGKPAERMMPDPIIVRWISDHYKGEGWYDDYGGTPMHVTHYQVLPMPIGFIWGTDTSPRLRRTPSGAKP